MHYALHKCHYDVILLGRDIAVDMGSPCILAQVSYRNPSFCYRSSNRCEIAVSCPNSVLECVKKCMGLHALALRAFTALRLLLSGDVELNPGPGSDNSDESASVDAIYAIVCRLEQGQTRFFTELEEVKKQQATLAISVQELQSTVNVLKTDLLSVKEGSSDIRRRLVDAEVSLVDAHNRSRRNNLIVFGLADCENESWNDSEIKAIAFFKDQLDQTVSAEDIERAHRLGRYNEGKNRPIIVNFCRFKVKEKLLSYGSKLKDTDYAIREDYNPSTRRARSKLFEYAQSTNRSFKLRFDKLHMDGKVFFYDSGDDKVKEIKR